ncbi:MAG: lysophospholipid acyltransferase family protein, partial [Candidatus Omnitrophica bacterium]|nr:lysophospholipid acyltransferase family protein [Candidatus Omnitrophota bacterium]
FFGKKTSTARGVARFARMSKAAILPVFCVREDLERYRAYFGDVIDAGTQSREDSDDRVMGNFAAQLEREIRKHPGQWLWPHRRWKSSPDREVLVLEDGKAGHRKQSEVLCKVVADAVMDKGHGGTARIHTVPVRYRSVWRRRLVQLWGIVSRGRFWGG